MGEIVAERHSSRRARPQGDAVQEVTHYGLKLGPLPHVDDPADSEVIEPAVAMQQDLERGDQHHVERRHLSPTQ